MKLRLHIVFPVLLSGILLFSEGCKIFHHKTKAEADNGRSENRFDDYFIDACAYLNARNYSAAIKLFNKCSELKPEEASVYYQLSRALELNNEPNSSLQNSLKAYNLAPDNVYYVLRYTKLLKDNGNLVLATSILEKAFSNHKKDELLLKALDDIYIRNTTLSRSSIIEKRIQLWEGYKSAAGYKLNTVLVLIELYKSNNNYSSAHALYDEIKKASPSKYQYYIDDANLYLLQNDEVNANLNFEKALAINPNNFNLNYSQFMQFAAKKNKELASKYLKQAFLDPYTDADKKLSTSAKLLQSSDFDTASCRTYLMIAASTLSEMYSENALVVSSCAEYYEKYSNFEAALSNYKKATILKPGLYASWFGALRMSNKLQRYQETCNIADQALEYYPNVAEVYLEAALASNQLKNYLKTIEYCSSGLSFAYNAESKFTMLKTIGYAYFMIGNYTEAEKSLNLALAIKQVDGELFEYIGNVYSKLNQSDKAIENWKKAKEFGLQSITLEKKIKEGKYVE